MKNQLLVVVPILLLLSAFSSSCVIEKRRYREGYYKKKPADVQTTPKDQPGSSSSQTNTAPPANHPTNQSQGASAQKPIRPMTEFPSWCIYGAYQEGLTQLSLNVERMYSFGEHADCYAHAGIGLWDIYERDHYKKYQFSAGGAVGFKTIKAGGEIGYGGYFNGMQGSGYYAGIIRITPGKKLIYLKFSLWKAMDIPAERDWGFSTGVGIAS